MQLNVERVSRNGIYADGQWHNTSKFAKPVPSLVGIEAGMTVEVEMNSKGWITNIASTKGQSASVMGPKDTPDKPVKKSYSDFKRDPDVRNEIARGTAVKAVLGSPLLYSLYKNEEDKKKTTEELTVLIRQFTGYILTGIFDEASAPVNVPEESKVNDPGKSPTDEQLREDAKKEESLKPEPEKFPT